MPLDKLKKVKSKFQVNDLFRVADSKRVFSKGDTTSWSYKVYKDTEIIKDTIPSYRIDNLSELYNKAFFEKKTNLTVKKTDTMMKKLKITWIKSNCF